MRPDILFSVPTSGCIEAQTDLAVAKICQRDDITYAPIVASPVDHARNTLVRMLLKDTNYSHLLMLDSDVIPGDDIVDLLLACDSPMAAAIVPICVQAMVVTNIIVSTADQPEGQWMTGWPMEAEPFEALGAGTGCVLIRREVFESIPFPWFRFQEQANGSRTGEDIYFSRKAARQGFRYRIHPKAVCDHYKKMSLLAVVKAFSAMQQERKEER